jgi:hypothetical protein
MKDASGNEAAGEQAVTESYGALVGWAHSEFKDRLDLKLQTIESTRLDVPETVVSHHVMMTKSQAAVLANFLLSISGQAPPPKRRRGLLGRLLGG